MQWEEENQLTSWHESRHVQRVLGHAPCRIYRLYYISFRWRSDQPERSSTLPVNNPNALMA